MRVAAAAVVAALLAAGCGGEGAASRAPERARLSQAPTATCEQWRHADRIARAAIMADLEAAFGRRVPAGGRGETVPRAQGVAVMDRACAQPFARNFRLWKLYERAVVFG